MTVQITLNERSLTVEKGTSILQAARQHGVYIPTLCDYPGLPPHGSCRMCIVEIQGKPNTPTACTTPVEEGMVIQTDSPKVRSLRAELLQMLLADHPSSCLFCPEKSRCDECMVTLRKAGVTTGCRSCFKDNQCELQAMVEQLGLAQLDYPLRYRMLPVVKKDPFFDRDYNLCVLCGRCVRTCAEMHFASVITLTERGTETVVGTAFDRTHLEAGCSFCGSCVEVCPTGALAEKTRKWDGKPDRETATTCPLCSLGCQMTLLSRNKTVIGSLPDHAAGTGELCVKGRFGITELVNHPTRLKLPQKFSDHGRLSIPWEETIELAAERLLACPPERFEMLISGNCTNEDLYVAQKFTRQAMRSARIRTIAWEGDPEGMAAVTGLLRQAQPLSVLAEVQTILCLGFDGRYSQSVVEVKLHRAKEKGARIVTLNAQSHSLGLYADAWLQPAPGQELDLLQRLIDLAGNQAGIPEGQDGEMEKTARILGESQSLAILIGPAFLGHPQKGPFLGAAARLADQTRARIILLPEEGNLAGSLLLGAPYPAGLTGSQETDVLYLIGEDIPAELPGDPFILYQNIYPPSSGRKANLSLPAAAFSEEEGSLIDHSGRVRELHPAVQPPAEALPTWEILCRVAQKMGVPGFDYTCAADIQAEIAGALPGFQPGERVDWQALLEAAWAPRSPSQPGGSAAASPQSRAHTYMGFPLTQWVAGLRVLYPDQTR